MGEVVLNNPEKQYGNLSVKDLINASLKGEKDLQKRILEKYESKGLKSEAKEELAKVLNVFKREIKELNNYSNLEYKDIKEKTKTDLSNLKAEVEQETKKELNVDELEKKLKQNYEIVDRLDELNDDLSDFDKVKAKLSNLDNYDEFTQMIYSLNDEKLEDKTYSLFAELTDEQIDIIIDEYDGLPTNKLDLIVVLKIIRENNLDKLKEIKEVENINIDSLDEMGEVEYIINKINDLLNSEGLSNKQIQKLQKRKIYFITKRKFLLNKYKGDLNKDKGDLNKDKGDLNKKYKEKNKYKEDLNKKYKEKNKDGKEVDSNIEKRQKIIDNIEKYKLNNFRNIPGISDLLDGNKNNAEKDEALKNVINYLQNPDNFHNFYRQAQEAGKSKDVYRFLKELSSVSPMISQLMSTIEVPDKPIDFGKESIADGILGVEGAKLYRKGEYFGENGEKIKIDGDVAELSNFSKSGYELETGKIDLKDVKGDIKELKEKYKELNNIAGDYYKLRELKLQIAKLGDNKEVIQDLLNENGFIDINDLNQDLEQKKEEYEENKKTFLEKKEGIKKVLKDKKVKLKIKNEKQKKTLKFLSKIGFDLIPQSITEQLIENINFAPDSYGFDSKIDLENGDLGMRGYGDDYISSKYKEKFLETFIKAIGSPEGEYEIKTDNVNNNSSVIDPSKLNLYLNKKGYKGLGSFLQMKNNLLRKDEKD